MDHRHERKNSKKNSKNLGSSKARGYSLIGLIALSHRTWLLMEPQADVIDYIGQYYMNLHCWQYLHTMYSVNDQYTNFVGDFHPQPGTSKVEHASSNL